MYGVLSLLISLAITLGVYIGIPVLISRVFIRKEVKRKTALFVCIINGILWWSVFEYLNIITGVNESPNTFATYIWSTVAYSLFLKEEKTTKIKAAN